MPRTRTAHVRPLEPASAEPLYVQLAARLAADISSGHLAPGQQLPTEAQTMQTYGVSRITVRQAIQLLARNGQVTSHRGKGTFVARTTLQQDLSTLQGFQEALRSQGVEPETELLEFSPSAGRMDPQRPADMDLPVRLRRRYCLDGEAFAVVEAYLPAEAAQLGEVRAEQLAVYDILQQYMALRIGRADVAIQCARPSRQVAAELGLPARTNVLVMRRTSFTVAGAPCEHMRIHIVPERYTFRLSVPGPLVIARALQPTSTAMAPTATAPTTRPRSPRR
ncbi:GntR family transcriptional regulator [Cupriavidus gilardii]|jgi:GntR family transcriptional regulator|uniref:GntR family transcriptional regulator n=1 Tax=Cupriavidus gilardii TaxID=82541 RepID=UPI00157FCDFD|nr:GntR family transcriptional regulator [Cupriavidus gilardii]MCT9069980.1 GntR family transcriptional regulator [Cupriavidus gilardii]QKS62028.1 GntR family transcriptional regulator [Cupriavidus gilardii]